LRRSAENTSGDATGVFKVTMAWSYFLTGIVIVSDRLPTVIAHCCIIVGAVLARATTARPRGSGHPETRPF